MMDAVEKMAADIALTMNGGEWKDGKWYSKGHREAWIKAVQPYADEIERLREALHTILCNTDPYAIRHRDYDHLAKNIFDCASAALKEEVPTKGVSNGHR